MSADAPASADVPVAEPSDLSPTTVDDVTPETDETGLAHVYSTKGKQYVVDVETGVCSCPDAKHNLDLDVGDRCKHAYRAEIALGRRGLPQWAELDAVDDRLCESLGLDE